jgi:hypothetical protein
MQLLILSSIRFLMPRNPSKHGVKLADEMHSSVVCQKIFEILHFSLAFLNHFRYNLDKREKVPKQLEMWAEKGSLQNLRVVARVS